jgi:hypothetical protein
MVCYRVDFLRQYERFAILPDYYRLLEFVI